MVERGTEQSRPLLIWFWLESSEADLVLGGVSRVILGKFKAKV